MPLLPNESSELLYHYLLCVSIEKSKLEMNLTTPTFSGILCLLLDTLKDFLLTPRELKQMNRKRLILPIFFIFLFFVLSGWCAEPVHLVILHVNDTHGRLFPYDLEITKDIGGIARMATQIKEIRADNKNTLVLHAGDDFSRGDPVTSCFGGEANMMAMEAVGYDAFTPGNGDFYFGVNNLIKQTSLVKFPTLLANVVYKDKKMIFQPYIIKEIDGIRIAILGLGYIDKKHPACQTLKLNDPIIVAQEYIPILRGKSDVIIALTHIGLGADKLLAEKVPDIDVIVGGHTHNLLVKPMMVPRSNGDGNVVVVQAGDYGQFLGRLDLYIQSDESGKCKVVKADETIIPIDNKIKEDEGIVQLLKRYSDMLSEVLFNSKIKVSNNEMGKLVAEVVRVQTDSDFALLDIGSIQIGIKAGDVTLADVYKIHPWRNRVLIFKLTGKQIKRVLSEKDVFVSGLSYTKSDGKVDNLKIGETLIKLTKTYKVAMGEYLWAYIPYLSDIPFTDTGETIDSILLKYFRNQSGK